MHNLHTEDNSCVTSQHKVEICISQTYWRNDILNRLLARILKLLAQIASMFFVKYFSQNNKQK